MVWRMYVYDKLTRWKNYFYLIVIGLIWLKSVFFQAAGLRSYSPDCVYYVWGFEFIIRASISPNTKPHSVSFHYIPSVFHRNDETECNKRVVAGVRCASSLVSRFRMRVIHWHSRCHRDRYWVIMFN